MNPDQLYKDHLVTSEEFSLRTTEPHGYLTTHPQPNADQLSKYYEHPDYHSHNEELRNLTAKLFHLTKIINTRYKIQVVRNYTISQDCLLDYGSGAGYFLEKIDKYFTNTCGIEPNPHAKKLTEKKNLHVVSNRNELTSNNFSCITLWHVLEHIPDLEQTLDWVQSHLKDDGTLFIAVPNHLSHDAKYYKQHWAGWDVPRHLWHFTKPTLTNLLEHHSMKVVKFLPLPFDSFYVSLLSEKYRNQSFPLPKAILQGLISNIHSLYTKQPSSFIAVVRKNDINPF